MQKHSMGFYERFIKRPQDFIISLFALVTLSPILGILAIFVRCCMGTPVIFKQARPGRNEEIFYLYKFRTMTDERDIYGNLLPDEERLTGFGKWLRATSLDELLSLLNIVKGNMSIVGPRPLLVQYLPLYNEKQKHRHDVRPGLTGKAQINGRNSISWEERFNFDIDYVNNITFYEDWKIIFNTVITVLKREGISSEIAVTMEEYKGSKN